MAIPRNPFPDLPRIVYDILFLDFITSSIEPSEADWFDNCDLLISQGLEGLALRFAGSNGFNIPRRIHDLLREASFTRMARSLEVVGRSTPVLNSLRRANIDFVVTKGPGISALSSSRADRSFSDLDLVVHPKEFARCIALLESLGFCERVETSPPRLYFRHLCREAINLRDPTGASIDVHHALPPWLWAQRLTFDLLRSTASPTTLFGVELPTVSPPGNLLVAAFHVVSDHGRPGKTLRCWRDVLVLSSVSRDKDVLEIAQRANAVEWLRWILSSLPIELRPKSLIAALTDVDARFPDVRRLRLVLSPLVERSPALEQCFRLPAWRMAPFILGMSYPSRDFVSNTYPESRSPYWEWWHHVLDGGSRRL
jgi:hypothetical protein